MSTPPSLPPLTAPLPDFLRNWAGALGLPQPRPAEAAPGPGALVPVPSAGVGLPPPGSAFWQRPDAAEKVLQAVSQLETERTALAQQAGQSTLAEQSLAKEVAELKARAEGVTPASLAHPRYAQAEVAKLERSCASLEKRCAEETRKGYEGERALAAKMEAQLLRFREQEQRLKAELELEVGRGRATEVLLQRKLDEERARTAEAQQAGAAAREQLKADLLRAQEALSGQLSAVRLGAEAVEQRRALEAQLSSLTARLDAQRSAMGDGGAAEAENWELRQRVSRDAEAMEALSARLGELERAREAGAISEQLQAGESEAAQAGRARHEADVAQRRLAAAEAARLQEENASKAALEAEEEARRVQARARERREAQQAEQERRRRQPEDVAA